ncbi:hypothetical protein ALO56_200091 [Pseudomonas viridiflava]|nr:hypothetical protein ALO56_200091 [Pseudomonas viridiflava]
MFSAHLTSESIKVFTKPIGQRAGRVTGEVFYREGPFCQYAVMENPVKPHENFSHERRESVGNQRSMLGGGSPVGIADSVT